MPAKSKSQQKLFGIVHGCQSGKIDSDICDSPNIKKLTKSVSYKAAKDFAKTKTKKLPERVQESRDLSFKQWIDLNENLTRTGLKFGYPDGYYRSQYPPLYSTPTSATAALDLENEKLMPKGRGENKSGLPDVIKDPKGMQSFPESINDWEEYKILVEALKNREHFDEVMRVINKLQYEKNIDVGSMSIEDLMSSMKKLGIEPPEDYTLERFVSAIKAVAKGNVTEDDFKPRPPKAPKIKFNFGGIDL